MKWKQFTVIFAAIFLLFGCQGQNNTQDESRGTDNTIDNTRYSDDLNTNKTDRNITRKSNEGNNLTDQISDRNRHSNNRSTNNRQDKYDVSDEAADRIVDEIVEIDRAYVLTTRNNAYVAAQLDENNTTPNDHLRSEEHTSELQSRGH